MVGMPGFFCQIFDQRFLARVLGNENTVYSTTGTEKYSFTVLYVMENKFLVRTLCALCAWVVRFGLCAGLCAWVVRAA